MRRLTQVVVAGLGAVLLIGLFLTPAQAQMLPPGFGDPRSWFAEAKPDTLEGTVIVYQDPFGKNHYLLDTNGDGLWDYYLYFGPEWYEPESGAQRPQDGSTVTVVGVVFHVGPFLGVFVTEIDGQEWREFPDWYWDEWTLPADTLTVTGVVLADTLADHVFLFLDVDDDTVADYYLDFGPPWYEPASGATRPSPGDTVTIFGVATERTPVPVLVVLEINGEVWRPYGGPPPWRGGYWFGKMEPDTIYVTSLDDTLLTVIIPPGAFRGMGPGGFRFPDSIFCQVYPIWPDSLPAYTDSVVVGWRFYLAGPDYQPLIGHGRMVRFFKRLRFVVRLPQVWPGGLGKAAENTYALKTWDEASGTWVTVATGSAGTIQGEVESLNSEYIALFKTGTATGLQTDGYLPRRTELAQNYPNPFNPATEIRYSIAGKHPVHVVLSIFDITGRLVAKPVNTLQAAGVYRIKWEARDLAGRSLPAGIYFYQLRAGDFEQTRSMVLLR